jgi:hypothetical protein
LKLVGAIALALMPLSAAALDLGSSEYVFVSGLAGDGSAPFAMRSLGDTSFGMTCGTDQHLCFIADTMQAPAVRQQTLLADIARKTRDCTVPNIPVVCILTQ